MCVRVAIVYDHDGPRTLFCQFLDHLVDRLRFDHGLDGVHDEVTQAKASLLLGMSKGFEDETGLAYTGRPYYADNLPGFSHQIPQVVAKNGQAFILHPRRSIVAGPTAP